MTHTCRRKNKHSKHEMTTESEVVGEKLCKLSTIPTAVVLKKCAAMCRLNCAKNFPRAKNENNYDLSTEQMYFLLCALKLFFKCFTSGRMKLFSCSEGEKKV